MKNAHATILNTAALELSQRHGQDVRLAIDEELDSQHTVLRCRLVGGGTAVPASVIIKQLPLDEASRANQPRVLARYRNEWATLRFLRDLPDKSIAPRVIFSDSVFGLIVLEDLGQRPSVQDLLYGNDPKSAGVALILIGRGLGRLHAATAGLEVGYLEMQVRFNATTPVSDATLDLRQYHEMFADCFTALKIEAATGFNDAVDDVAAAVHGPGPFRALCHNDAGAHNFLPMDGHVRLLDFEFAGYQHAFTDLVAARLGFPPSYRGRTSPPELVEQLEATYRAEVSRIIPRALDDEIFTREREAACAHLVLAKLVGMWQVYLRHRLTSSEAFDSRDGRTPERVDYFRRMNLTFLIEYLNTTEVTCFQPSIRDTFRSLVDALLRLWPLLTPLPQYPAFETAG